MILQGTSGSLEHTLKSILVGKLVLGEIGPVQKNSIV